MPSPIKVTQEALDRIEDTLRREIEAAEKLNNQRFSEHERRLGELNNSHATAVEAKRRTDEAATRLAAESATKDDLSNLRREVDKSVVSQSAQAIASARFWSIATSVAGGVIVYYLTHR